MLFASVEMYCICTKVTFHSWIRNKISAVRAHSPKRCSNYMSYNSSSSCGSGIANESSNNKYKYNNSKYNGGNGGVEFSIL